MEPLRDCYRSHLYAACKSRDSVHPTVLGRALGRKFSLPIEMKWVKYHLQDHQTEKRDGEKTWWKCVEKFSGNFSSECSRTKRRYSMGQYYILSGIFVFLRIVLFIIYSVFWLFMQCFLYYNIIKAYIYMYIYLYYRNNLEIWCMPVNITHNSFWKLLIEYWKGFVVFILHIYYGFEFKYQSLLTLSTRIFQTYIHIIDL